MACGEFPYDATTMSHHVPKALGAGAIAVFAAIASPAVAGQDPTTIPPRDPRLSVERLVRRLDWRDGLPASYLSTVVQDRDGFLWVSGPGGVSRYDGNRFKTVYSRSAALISGCSRSGRVVFCDTSGQLREVRGTAIIELGRPQAGPGEAEWAATVAGDGAVWWKQGNRIWRTDATGVWKQVPSPVPPDAPPRALLAGLGPEIFVTNRDGLWRLAANGTAREVTRLRGIFTVIERADGSIVVGANQPPGPVTARAFEVRGGTPRLLFERAGAKITGLVQRDTRLWIATDNGLFGIAEGAPPLFISTSELLHSSGDVFVDREGSLWVATFRGLVQLPEPETYAASLVKVARTLVHTGKRTWLSSWGELARFEDGSRGMEARSFGVHFGIVCSDGGGHAWVQGRDRLALIGENSLQPAVGDRLRGELMSCSVGPSGTMWMSIAPAQLLALRPSDRGPRDLHAAFPDGVDWFYRVREAPDGMLWAAADRRVCRTSAAALLEHEATAWTCEDGITDGEITDLAFMPSGDVWLATSDGLVRRENGRWEPLGANVRIRSRWILAIRPSPSGGVWLASMGSVMRVVERPGTPDGLEIVEELSAWHGVPTLNGTDIAEDPDGTLWCATDAGLLKVPGAVRRGRPQPPPVALIEATADGRALAGDRPIELPYRRNRLELRFAAMSYRDPTAIQYRHRLHANDPWSPSTSNSLFRFVDLSPGRYRIDVEASLDGERWSVAPAVFAFRVLKPWYLQAWFFAIAALAIAGLLTLVYRLRVRTLLRLERQRTRIAMDLHDEVGSGLGTISVLAGLVGRPELGAAQRDEFATRMATVSRELSQALGDIVWSLRPGSGSLDAAWHQIVDRSRPLFASGAPCLDVVAPEPVPALALSVVARRSLFLIAIEALHNAARHSGATRVTLELARSSSEWTLTVTDDGRGIATSPTGSARRGLGLDGMRARAADMRAAIAWEKADGGGTRVVLRFRPESE